MTHTRSWGVRGSPSVPPCSLLTCARRARSATQARTCLRRRGHGTVPRPDAGLSGHHDRQAATPSRAWHRQGDGAFRLTIANPSLLVANRTRARMSLGGRSGWPRSSCSRCAADADESRTAVCVLWRRQAGQAQAVRRRSGLGAMVSSWWQTRCWQRRLLPGWGLIRSDVWPMVAAHLLACGHDGEGPLTLACHGDNSSGWQVDPLIPCAGDICDLPVKALWRTSVGRQCALHCREVAILMRQRERPAVEWMRGRERQQGRRGP
jgi:hypothetical protein